MTKNTITLQEALSRSARNHAKGNNPARPLCADPHRDTGATLCEYRTRWFGLRLSYDDIEGEFDLEIAYGRDPDGYSWRQFRLHPASLNQAHKWVDRLVARHPLIGFTCMVDM